MARTLFAVCALLCLAACATTDPSKISAMQNWELATQWNDYKSEPAMEELVRRGKIDPERVDDVKSGKIWVGMSKAAMFTSRLVCNPDYHDADGNEIYEYSGTYVKVRGDRVVDWWTVR